MNYVIYGTITIFIFLYILLYRNKRSLDGTDIKSFSGDSGLSAGALSFYNFQLKRYSMQQSWAFGLLWTAILVSLVLGGLLIYKKFIINDSNPEWLAESIGLAGGSGVCLTSFRLYKATTKKIDDLLSKIGN